MAKQCSLCGITKEVKDFSKCTANKDGLQNRCKTCNKKDNQHFRNDIQPDYQLGWYKTHRKEWSKYTLDYKRAVNTPTIYGILNPDGEMYVGSTMARPKIRFMQHRIHYRQIKKGVTYQSSLPKLHESFDKYGEKGHTLVVLAQFEGIDRKLLNMIETTFIKAIMMGGKSLNVRNY
jgi:hypothetical protein